MMIQIGCSGSWWPRRRMELVLALGFWGLVGCHTSREFTRVEYLRDATPRNTLAEYAQLTSGVRMSPTKNTDLEFAIGDQIDPHGRSIPYLTVGWSITRGFFTVAASVDLFQDEEVFFYTSMEVEY